MDTDRSVKSVPVVTHTIPPVPLNPGLKSPDLLLKNQCPSGHGARTFPWSLGRLKSYEQTCRHPLWGFKFPPIFNTKHEEVEELQHEFPSVTELEDPSPQELLDLEARGLAGPCDLFPGTQTVNISSHNQNAVEKSEPATSFALAILF